MFIDEFLTLFVSLIAAKMPLWYYKIRRHYIHVCIFFFSMNPYSSSVHVAYGFESEEEDLTVEVYLNLKYIYIFKMT